MTADREDYSLALVLRCVAIAFVVAINCELFWASTAKPIPPDDSEIECIIAVVVVIGSISLVIPTFALLRILYQKRLKKVSMKRRIT